MASMTFSNDMARIQRAVAQCHDIVLRRGRVFEAMQLRRGERVLEIGCGGGFYAAEAARFVGSAGEVRAIDISADQVAAAQSYCAELDGVTCEVANATSLPYEDASFDVVYGIQVLEYVTPLETALREVQRVLRPGGRCAIVASDWDTGVWHSRQPERMRRVLTAFEAHSPIPNLPSILGVELRQAGLEPLRQTPITMLSRSANENSFSYWIARMVHAFVVGRQAIAAEEADAWLQEFDALEQEGANFFCITSVLTEAIKTA